MTGGMLSAAAHDLHRRRVLLPSNAEGLSPSFGDVCRAELETYYDTLYTSAQQRQEDHSAKSPFFQPGSYFYGLLSNGTLGASNIPHIRAAILMFSNSILCDCAGDGNAMRERVKKSALLTRLLSSGKGDIEALGFALLTSDRADGSHRVDDPVKAAALARCMYAYNRLTWHVQLQLETSLMSFLLDDPSGLAHACDPARFRWMIAEDLRQQGTVVSAA